MSGLRTSIGDFDLAIKEFAWARGEDDVRRQLRHALACLYEIREHRADAEHKAYFPRALADPLGLITEGVVLARGSLTHAVDLSRGHEIRPLWISDSTLTSDDLLISDDPNDSPTPFWRPFADLWISAEVRANPHYVDREAAYRSHVEGQPVVVTLRAAWEFLRLP